MAKSISTLAMVFYLFVTVNQLTYLAVFQMSNFFAILNRISSVLQLENFKVRTQVKEDIQHKAETGGQTERYPLEAEPPQSQPD